MSRMGAGERETHAADEESGRRVRPKRAGATGHERDSAEAQGKPRSAQAPHGRPEPPRTKRL